MKLSCNYCDKVLCSIKNYVNHCRLHRNNSKTTFSCPIFTCKRQLFSYSGLKSHIYRSHDKSQKNNQMKQSSELSTNADIILKCSVILCQKVCETVPDLIKHVKEHIHAGTEMPCPFKECTKVYCKKSSFSSHLSRNHSGYTVQHLSSDYINCNGKELESAELECIDATLDLESVHLPVDTETDLFVRSIALFYLQLQSKYLVPSSTIQYIVDEMKEVQSLNLSILFSQLLLNLTSKLNISHLEAQKLLNEVRSADPLSSLYSNCLQSNYARKSLIKKLFRLVEPVTVNLGSDATGKLRSFQYIPVIETIQSMFTCNTVREEVLLASTSRKEFSCILSDLHDGKSFKNNAFFQENVVSLRLLLYQDAFEVYNPIGSSRKKHKILGVYMNIANFRPQFRSNVENIQLVLLCKETDFKYFGHEKVFLPLIHDLKKIEEGIWIRFEDNEVLLKGTLSCICGDNLGSHCIAGFCENFSTVSYFCRYCTNTMSNFHDNPYSFGSLRTKESYKNVLEQLESSETGVVEGIKFNSVFNNLKYFHVCSYGLPPCLGHDIFEGVLSYDLILYLNFFVKSKQWFTFSELNERIFSCKYKGFDKNNIPCKIDYKKKKLGGTAVQNWTLIRLLPILIGSKIQDSTDEVWQQTMCLRDIVEYVCAPSISTWQIAHLRVLTEQYMECRCRLFSNHKLKPKHHYLMHYPALIMQYGPLIRLWTLRFESKHSYFKRCARYALNFKNICFTMADRHQLLQAFKYSGSFFGSSLQLGRSMLFQLDCYSDAIQNIIMPRLQEFKHPVEVATEVTFYGITYKKGDYIVYSNKSLETIIFGKICFMCSDSHKLFFVGHACSTIYCSNVHVYRVTSSRENSKCFCVEKDELLDYQSLPSYSSGKLLTIPLKHSIALPNVY